MNPKVSIRMITFNQEKYIAQAIESVLMQQVNFHYELVIGEDFSTDGTRDIVKKYAEQHPDKIRAILRSHNLGIHGRDNNGIATLMECKGQYVALLEGDDYWTDSLKLRKQVDFLDSHQECSICFHPVEMFLEGSDHKKKISPRWKKDIYSLKDLLWENFIPTCSTMFRSGLIGKFPDWYYVLPFGDWPLHILNAQHGDIGFIDEVMGAYRVQKEGVWSGKGELRQLYNNIAIYKHINVHLNFRYDRLIKIIVFLRYCRITEKKMEFLFRRRGLNFLAAFMRKIFDPYAFPE